MEVDVLEGHLSLKQLSASYNPLIDMEIIEEE